MDRTFFKLSAAEYIAAGDTLAQWIDGPMMRERAINAMLAAINKVRAGIPLSQLTSWDTMTAEEWCDEEA